MMHKTGPYSAVFKTVCALTLLMNAGTVPCANAAASPQYSAITAVADSLGFTWQWERSFGRLQCAGPSVRFRFYENNTFYYVNGTVEQLPEAPRRIGSTLYLSRPLLEELFSPSQQIGTPPERRLLTAPSQPGMNIIAVASEKKSNGTLLSIILTDSLPFDITYFYPNLTFNFFGGKVDTTTIRQRERIGFINSIFSVQFASSAQITALLNRDIEEPMIDYVEDTRTIMVSIRPRKTPKQREKTPANPTKKTGEPLREPTIIVIDPGHGGKDPGAIGSGSVREKDVVLAVGLQLRELLSKRKDIKIYMTRDADVFVPLADRTRFANDKKAHLFISLHADAVGGDAKRKQSTSGYKIYFLSQAKNEEDKLVAMRENAVIELEERPQNYSHLQNVLIDLAGNEYLRESQDLCILLDRTFSASADRKVGKLHKGVGQANFWVLNGAFMPAVLIEMGFLSNKKEEKILADPVFQNEIAAAISKAVIAFCEKYGAGQ